MPGFLLSAGSLVLCSHGGQAQAIQLAARVRLGGQPAVAQAAPFSVAGCPYTLPGAPPVPQPCVAVQWASGATRVRSQGQLLLLQDSQGTCVPNGTAPVVQALQARVKGM